MKLYESEALSYAHLIHSKLFILLSNSFVLSSIFTLLHHSSKTASFASSVFEFTYQTIEDFISSSILLALTSSLFIV
ncbi:hypothetical protein HOG27_06640 [bacterium]|nr:hypothetical protein [bacterium]